jgi:hypothetical protein
MPKRNGWNFSQVAREHRGPHGGPSLRQVIGSDPAAVSEIGRPGMLMSRSSLRPRHRGQVTFSSPKTNSSNVWRQVWHSYS